MQTGSPGPGVSGRPTGELPDLSGYFDYAASAPPCAETLRTYAEVAGRCFGNPSSQHRRGMQAREALEGARERFKQRLGARAEARLVLTSGGTEANNLALHGVLGGSRGDARLLMANDVHASAWQVGHRYRDRVDVLEVDGQGRIHPDDLARRLGPKHRMVSIVHGNNETGIVQDLEGISRRCRERGVLLHVDGVQTVGHLPLALGALTDVLYTFSAHKFGGPRNTGGLITGSPEALGPLLLGGSQEQGLRAGTQDPAALCATVTALELSLLNLSARRARLRGFGERIVSEVVRRFPSALVNSGKDGLAGIVSVSVPGLNATMAVAEMAMRGFDLSAGSACHAGSTEPSRVIRALGRTRLESLGTLRISMGRGTTEEGVEAMVTALLEVIERGLEVS